MPSTSLSDAIKEAYASAPSDIIILHTLEFRHPNFSAPIRVVNDKVALHAKLEATAPLNPSAYVDFVAFSFDFSLPDVQSTAMPEIVITIDNVSREIEDNLAIAVASPYQIDVTYRPYLSNDLTQPQWTPPLTMTISQCQADDFQVVARASMGDMANRKFPNQNYNSERFPGLMR